MDVASWLEARADWRPEVLWADGRRTFCRIQQRDPDGTRHLRLAVYPSQVHAATRGDESLEHEYMLRDHIDDAWGMPPRALLREHGQTVLILDHREVVPLTGFLGQPMDVGRTLQLAVAISTALAGMHARGLVHRDIQPANLLVDAAGVRAWITGFGVAIRLSHQRHPAGPSRFIAGTPSHMAPEQTGTIDHPVDTRCDLYALGVTLYQTLTATLPFFASDPMELAHCHIARTAVPPDARAPHVPAQVSAVVMKLLAKTPDARYQTAEGVAHDLRRCLADWDGTGSIDRFTLGQADVADATHAVTGDARHFHMNRAPLGPADTVHSTRESLSLPLLIDVIQSSADESTSDGLVDRLMRLGLVHAGATRGVLLVRNGDALEMLAEARVAGTEVSVERHRLPVTLDAAPEPVLHRVLATTVPVLVRDASVEQPYCDHTWIRDHAARSIVCLPLLERTTPVGLLYFENTLAPGVFTHAILPMLRLIAAQASSSLALARRHAALQAQEARVRRLADSNIIGIVTWHADGRVLDTNDAFLRIVGYARDELLSGRLRWTDLIPSEWRAPTADALHGMKDTGVVHVHEREYVRKDGTRVPVLTAGALFDETSEEGVAFVVDLTERKRAEDALRHSERSSRLIVDSIPAMICVLSPEGEIEFMNRQGLQYFGLELEDMLRWKTGGMTHPDDLQRGIEQVGGALAAGVPWDVEVRGLRADGVYRWTQTRGAPLRDDSGRINGWYNVIIDIDERKRAEEALAASERNFKLIIDTMPALAWSATPDGAADFFSQHYLKYVGLSAEQASGVGWTAAVHPEDVHALATAWHQSVRDGVPAEAEARIRRHDGEYRWFLIRTSPLRDETGAIVKWYGVNADIEDRKRVEAELRRAYGILAEAQRLTRCGSFFADFTTDDRVWSEELSRILELDPSVRTTRHLFRSMVHPEDLPAYDGLAAQLASGRDVENAFRIITSRGVVKHLRSVAHVLEWKAGSPVCVGAVQDVTETVAAEQALSKARSELAHVARVSSLGALTASIAHEVNQPLAGIVTNASTCLRMLDADPPNTDGAREMTKRTIRDGHRAADVIARLRSLFSKKDFTLETMDLNDATREVIAMSASDLQRHRVTLQTQLAPALPPIMADRVQLQQVILNLLRNAADAMADVTDRPRQLLITTAPEDEAHVRCTVADSGVGIDADAIDRVFDAFYTTKSSGMGIGLSVSRSIIERHQGRLWVERTAPPGATFAFSIPCQPERSGSASTPSEHES